MALLVFLSLKVRLYSLLMSQNHNIKKTLPSSHTTIQHRYPTPTIIRGRYCLSSTGRATLPIDMTYLSQSARPQFFPLLGLPMDNRECGSKNLTWIDLRTTVALKPLLRSWFCPTRASHNQDCMIPIDN